MKQIWLNDLTIKTVNKHFSFKIIWNFEFESYDEQKKTENRMNNSLNFMIINVFVEKMFHCLST